MSDIIIGLTIVRAEVSIRNYHMVRVRHGVRVRPGVMAE